MARTQAQIDASRRASQLNLRRTLTENMTPRYRFNVVYFDALGDIVAGATFRTLEARDLYLSTKPLPRRAVDFRTDKVLVAYEMPVDES